MGWSFAIGTVAGTTIRIHVTFLLLLGWIAVTHGAQGGTAAAVDGVVFISLVFACVVLHEFGHTLGCIHEHERPDNGIPWDKPKVYAYYKETDGWSRDEVDEQVFSKYDITQIRANKLDKKSIMMYPVPNELTKGNFSIGWNNGLSEADKKFIAKLYPKK